MNALKLYQDLKTRGVILEAVAENLKVNAPAGALTEKDKAVLVENKPALLKLLSGAEERDHRRRFKSKRSKYPGYTSLYDPVHDEWHDFPTRDCFPSIVAEANQRRKGSEKVDLEKVDPMSQTIRNESQ